MALDRDALDLDAIEQLVSAALQEHIPDSFRVTKLDREQGWAIDKIRTAPGEWANQDYRLWVTGDLAWVIASYGNTDAGIGTPTQRALIFPVVFLTTPFPGQADPFRGFLLELLSCEPNIWGLT
jgi:hypothetical protein